MPRKPRSQRFLKTIADYFINPFLPHKPEEMAVQDWLHHVWQVEEIPIVIYKVKRGITHGDIKLKAGQIIPVRYTAHSKIVDVEVQEKRRLPGDKKPTLFYLSRRVDREVFEKKFLPNLEVYAPKS